MTKISQLTDIGGGLAANDEFIIRDVSDASTPNKKVTASGFFNVATALGFAGLDVISTGVTNEAKVQVFASGISGRTDTTLSGIVVARTTVSGYYENASGTVGGVLFPVVTQTDIGTAPNQVPVNGMLGGMAYQDPAFVSIGTAFIGTANVDSFNNVPLLTGGGVKFPPTQVPSADPNTLDDYEEGTWTPTIFMTGVTVTYNTQFGSYRKIGNTVYVQFQVISSTFTFSSASGDLLVANLPFTAGVNSQRFGAGLLDFGGLTMPGYTQVGVRTESGYSFFAFNRSGSGQTSANVDSTNVTSGTNVRLSGEMFYYV